MIGEFLLICFHARTNAHVLHLQTRSYAAHKALNEFYDEIVDLADAVAEAYQGKYGLIDTYPPRYTPVDDPVKLITELRSWIDDNRYECCNAEDTALHNMIDEIVALCDSTLYKLRFLK